MKIYLFVLLSLVGIRLTYGQDTVFLTSKGKRPSIILDVAAQRCLVFKLDSWSKAHLAGESILSADTLFPQSDGRYVSKQNSLRKEGTMWILFQTDSSHTKPKRQKLQVQTQTDDIFYRLNDAYWWTHFLQLTNEINARFKPLHYGFRNGYSYWQSFSNQKSPYLLFQAFADEKLKTLKDSLVTAHTVRMQRIKAIVALPYAGLKDTVSRLDRHFSYNSDMDLVVNTLIHTNPALFFQLAQDLPDLQKELFVAADQDWESRRILRSVDTPLDSRRKYLKKRRKDDLLMVAGVTGVVLAETLVIIGIVSLF